MDREVLEKQVLEIVKAKHIRSGGHNGSPFNEFEHLFKGFSNSEMWEFFQSMVDAKKIVIREGANKKMIMLPK
ncbi:hypothetical protein ACMGDK_11720 [Chryseobacterium sp. DT-3]|uniref:hypothetical protein n=1 Tax=Chryseobacterium sp. DT-3 TaxID=3396164 RepID=UPI003F1C3C61